MTNEKQEEKKYTQKEVNQVAKEQYGKGTTYGMAVTFGIGLFGMLTCAVLVPDTVIIRNQHITEKVQKAVHTLRAEQIAAQKYARGQAAEIQRVQEGIAVYEKDPAQLENVVELLADANQDGKITEDERKKVYQTMGAKYETDEPQHGLQPKLQWRELTAQEKYDYIAKEKTRIKKMYREFEGYKNERIYGTKTFDEKIKERAKYHMLKRMKQNLEAKVK